MTEPTGRRTASTITDTELDQLYAERDELGREADRLFKAAAEQHARAEQVEDLLRVAHETSNTSEAERARAVQRAERAEGELLRSVNARETLCADRNAAEQRAERAEAERDALKGHLQYVLDYDGPGHLHLVPGRWDADGSHCDHCARLAQARAALDEHQEQP